MAERLVTLPAGWSRLLVVIAAGSLIGLATPAFAGLLNTWGYRIPQPVIEADYIAGVLWAGVLGFSIFFWPVPDHHVKPLLLLWLARVFVTLGFMLLYEWYYPLDAYQYFRVSTQPFFDLGRMGFGRGTDNLEGLAWLHAQLMPDSYHAMKVSFAMIGFLSVYITYRGVRRMLGRDHIPLLYFLGLFPSILFWSSILGKDPIQLFGIAIYIYGVACWRTGSIRRGALAIALGTAIAAYIRFWSAPILMLPLVVYTLIGMRGVVVRGLLLIACTVALYGLTVTFSYLSGLTTVASIVEMAGDISENDGWSGGSGQQYSISINSTGSMITFLPIGMFAALFRPIPGEVMNPFALMAGIENLYLLFLLGAAIVRTSLEDLKEPLVGWAATLVLSWAAIYGFVSAYNLGAAVRFKLQILPVMVCLLIYLARKRFAGDMPLVVTSR